VDTQNPGSSNPDDAPVRVKTLPERYPEDQAQDSHGPFGSRGMPRPEHDCEQVLLGLIVDLQGTDDREAAPGVVLPVDEAQLLLS
jgi:hypothetical protein